MSSRKETQKRAKPRSKPYKRDQFDQTAYKQVTSQGDLSLEALEEEFLEEDYPQ